MEATCCWELFGDLAGTLYFVRHVVPAGEGLVDVVWQCHVLLARGLQHLGENQLSFGGSKSC